MAFQADSTGQAQNQTTQATGQAQQPQSLNFFEMGGMLGISSNATSEILTKAKTAMELSLVDMAELNQRFEIKLVPIDNAKETPLHMSSLAVCVKSKANKASKVSVHLVLLEGSGQALQPKIEQNQGTGHSVQIDRLTSDVLDADYYAIAGKVLQQAFPGATLIDSSNQIMPRTFNLEDKAAVRTFVINAVNPGVIAIAREEGRAIDIDLSRRDPNIALSIVLGFVDETITDPAGLPVRSSVTMRTIASTNQKANPNGINTAEKSREISKATGFIDFVWAADPNAQMQSTWNGAQRPVPKLATRLVLTALETQNDMPRTIASQLMALVGATALRENLNYLPYFTPKALAGKKTIDMRDVGALNIEADIFGNGSGPIETKSSTFTMNDLAQFMSAATLPGMLYSIDVADCGADTWYNNEFAGAAQGNPDAIRKILEASDILTGGRFSQLYNSNASPIMINDDRHQLGYYTDAEGRKRDIRDIDLVAFLNIVGVKDKQAIIDFSATFTDLATPSIIRLDKRRKLIQGVLPSSDIVLTGYATRATFDRNYVDVLTKACADVGYTAVVTNGALASSYGTQRQSFNGLSSALLGSTPNGAFTSGWATRPTQQFSTQNRGFQSRFTV